MKEIRCVHTVTGEVKFFTEYLVNTSDFKRTKYIIQEAPQEKKEEPKLSVDVQNLVHTASTTADIPPTFAEEKPKKAPAKKSKSNKKING